MTEDKNNIFCDEIYKQVAILFREMHKQYLGRSIFFQHFKNIKLIKLLLEISLELNVTFDIFLKSQFVILAPYLKRINKQAYIKFDSLVTEKAIDRYFSYQKRITAQNTLHEDRKAELNATKEEKISMKYVESLEKFLNRLKFLTNQEIKITKELAIKELEMLTRTRILNPIYIYLHPLQKETIFLTSIHNEVKTRLNKYQKCAVEKIRKIIEELIIEDNIKKYV